MEKSTTTTTKVNLTAWLAAGKIIGTDNLITQTICLNREKKLLRFLLVFVFVFSMLVPTANSQERKSEKRERKSERKEGKNFRKERESEERERESEEKERDGARQALDRDVKMTKDPALGYVPADRILLAKAYKDQLMQQHAPISNVTWHEQGPTNLGGRTRTIMVDPSDATGNTVFAGSVGGGLWRTTNVNSSSPNWQPVNDLLNNLAVTSIAFDPTNTNTMYFCTGEGYFNLDAIRGLGVFKSTDGGLTWAQLSSTNNSTFNFCQKVVVNSTGIVFVSTSTGGLQRSANGGTTWTKVLGTGLGITGAGSNFCYDVEVAANGDIYSSLDGSVHKSTNAGVTFAAAQTLPITAGRIELACAPSDANYVFALVENASAVAGILRTTNGGTAWVARTEPADADGGIPAADFSRGQAWYDLSIAVDPNNRDRLFVGGVDIFASSDGAGTWSQITHWYGGFGFQYSHADQHSIVFKNGSSSIAYFGNDGGVFRTANANATVPTLDDKNLNYRTGQFYACAIHPTAFANYYLAGAQDNGTHKFTQSGLQPTTEVTGGDGAFCHIDQDQPQYQFSAYVYNDFYRSSDGGNTWTNFTSTGGQFISPTDYDDVNNRMYICKDNNNYLRWDNPQTGSTFTTVAVAGFGGQVSAVKVSPNTANRVFFGIDNGDVFRVDNANTATPTATNISTGLPAGYVSCVEVQTGNDNHLLVTYSNYGLNSVWESTNGGTSWTSVEGNLPDMPIRWALFNPNNSAQAILATELGVWSTTSLSGGTTNWGASNSGLANVRVDMLQVRQSDKYVIAATHGRGLFSSDIFTTPTALFSSDLLVTYINKPIQFTSTSYQGSSWSWDFGDGSAVSTLENPTHSYTAAGTFDVTLTLNGGASTLTKTQYIQVLPDRGTPYSIANGGGFEVNTSDFGADNQSGTAWQRGNSAVAGKSGVHGGSNAWVTGLVGNYVDNADVSLMTPSYNLTAAGTYTLSFWTKYITESNYDGFRVQYTLDKGTTWTQLGVVATGWYNFSNTVGDAAFPINEAFFSGTQSTYANKTRDISFLSGNSSVAFRIQFKSDNSVTAAGVAIDDFEILGPVNAPVGGSSIVTTGSLTPFTACSGTASAQQSFTVSGSNLSANLVVTAPTGFEVSTTFGSGFAGSVSLTPSSGTVSSTTIFVRMASSASGTPSGNIAFTSTGATTQNVAASGTVNALPSAAVTPTSGTLTCTTTSIGLTASGGGTYLWNAQGGNSTSPTISATTAGTFSVTVTGVNGCTAGASAVIASNTTPPSAAVTPTSGTLTCTTTSIGLTASGGGTYLWNTQGGNSTSPSISATTAGTYSVTVTGANGCTAGASAVITSNTTPPTAAVTPTSGTLTCTTTSIGLTASGGGTYLWNAQGGNSTSPTISATTAGTFSVTVTGVNGCTAGASAVITSNTTPPSAAVTPTSGTLTCTTTSIGLTASGGGTYLWNAQGGNSTSPSISATTAGTYSVTVTGANGCTAGASAVITSNTTPPTATVTPTSGTLTCTTTSIGLTASGGGTYLWNAQGGNSTSPTISATTAGTYSVTVTGANGCTAGASAVITSNTTPPSAAVTPTSGILTCTTTSIGLTASGGGTYLWNAQGGNSTSPTISATTAGTYSVTVTGANGCTAGASAVITSNTTPPSAAVTPTSGTLTCTTTSIGLTASGGGTYLWNAQGGNSTSPTISATTAGTYSVTVTGANGCTAGASAVITSNTTAPNATITASNGLALSCAVSSTVLSVPTPGGTTQSWTLNGAFFSSASNPTVTSAGVYEVTVTNTLSGCTATSSVTVTAATGLPDATITASNGLALTCSVTSTVLSVPIPGGTTQSWTLNGAFFSSASNPTVTSAGVYEVTVTNTGSGCTATSSVTITLNNTPPTVTISSGATELTCTTTSITLTASGASSYLWSNGDNTSTTSVSTPNSYTVTGTDASNGCSATSSAYVITQNITTPDATITASNGLALTCSVTSTVLSVLTPGGTTQSWTLNGAFFSSASNPTVTSAGVYEVTVTNTLSGCTATSSVTVTAATGLPDATISASNGLALSCSVSSTVLSVPTPGGTTQSWTLNGAFFSSASNPTVTTAGVYEVTVTNTLSGCTATSSVTVTAATGLPDATISASNGLALNCSITSTVLSVPTPGGTTQSWTLNGAFFSSASNPTVTSAGVYEVTVTNTGSGCTATSFVTITLNNTAPTIAISSGITELTCTTTSITLTATGASSYLWSNGDNTSTTSVSTPNSYTVTGTDASNGCSATSSAYVITQNITAPDATITANPGLTFCQGSSTVLSVPVTGTTSQVWNENGVFFSTLSNPSVTVAATYDVTVTDAANGCTASSSVTTIVNTSPVGSASNIVICNGDAANLPLSSTIAGTTFTWTSSVTVGAVIGNGSCSSNCATTISDVLTNIGNVYGVVEYTITPIAPGGCVGADFTADVTVGAAPANPGAIAGPNAICGLTSATYSIAPIPEATNYTWTITTGAAMISIVSGQGTPSINVAISTGNLNLFVITVVASNSCGSSSSSSISITKKPGVPDAITGPTSTCGQTAAAYSIAPVFSATSYIWSVPAGMSIVSGQGTTNINVSMTSAFVIGQVKVSAVNNCGFVPGASLLVTGNVPSQPVTVSGPANVCGITSATYSVAPVIGATGYLWTVTGTGMSISGSPNGTSVTVLMNGTNGGTVSCAATNVCGNGAARTLNLSVAAIQPASIAGPTNICGVSSATYSVSPVGTGYTYNWSLTLPGWSITSGNGTNSIIISGPATGTTGSGLVKVTSTNTCGNTSAFRTMAVTYCHDGIAMNNNETNSNTFSNIYPNPASSEFTIDVVSAGSTTENQEVTVEVYDVLGNLVIHSKHQLADGTNTIKTDIKDFTNGMYFVRLLDVDSNVIYTQRVIKQ